MDEHDAQRTTTLVTASVLLSLSATLAAVVFQRTRRPAPRALAAVVALLVALGAVGAILRLDRDA